MKGLWCKMPYTIINHQQLTPAAKLLYAAIAYRVGSNDCCWPGIRRLARDTQLTARTVGRSLEQLRKLGLLKVERGTSGRTNRYRLSSPTVDKMSIPRSEKRQNVHSAVRKMSSQAWSKCPHNKIKEPDTLNTSTSASLRNADVDEKNELKTQARIVLPPAVAEFLQWFRQAYRKSTGDDYSVPPAKEAVIVQRMLKNFSRDKLQAATLAMLDDPRWTGRACVGVLWIRLHYRTEKPAERVGSIRGPDPAGAAPLSRKVLLGAVAGPGTSS